MPLAHSGLGGIAATDKYVIFGDRDLDDFQDVFRCHDAKTGKLLWQTQTLAIGKLDYGNSPRATPLIDGQRAFLLGAFGHLTAVKLATGEVIWKRDFRDEFGVNAELPWGFCGSPLLVDGKLIVQPGGPKASLVALEPATGKTIWQTAGRGPSHGSLLAGRFGGRLQIVGHDATTLGGWDPASGKRLWETKPAIAGDFNVPTPVNIGGKLLITTENNGTRLYEFGEDGTINAEPVATSRRFAPDMSTPVAVGDRVFGVHRMFIGLDAADGLKQIARLRDEALGDYGSVIASGTKVLVVGKGELLLIDARDRPRITSRLRVFDDDVTIYSHPAIAGKRLFIRGESSLRCLALE